MAVRVRDTDVRHRLRMVSILLSLFYAVLVCRLVYLQVVPGDHLREAAQRDRERVLTPKPERGGIYTRDAHPFAYTMHTGNLVCDPTLVRDAQAAANVLARITGVAAESVAPSMAGGLRRDGKPIRHAVVIERLKVETIARLQAALRSKRDRAALEGLSIEYHTERAYPAGRDAEHLVGYLVGAPDGGQMGGAGLELSQDAILRGVRGKVRTEVDPRGRPIPGTQSDHIDPVDGCDIHLTIDSAIQHMVRTELEACCQKYRPAGATAIVVDPSTGDVLAMVSWRDYDPGKLPNPVGPDGESLRNRALMLYEPGSTLKIITAAAALDEGVVTPDTQFECGGTAQLAGRTIRCSLHGAAEAHGHGTLTLRQVIARSCNVSTAEIGLRVGLPRLEKRLRSFGLLQRTGVGLPGEARGTLRCDVAALRPAAARVRVSRVAFGQSVQVSPLALVQAYAAIANGGRLMQARLIEGYYDSGGDLVKACPPRVVDQAVSPGTAAELRSYLTEVVTSGTGRDAAVPGYTVAGKTGTAQKVVNPREGYARGKYVASFIGFVPAQKPRAVILVAVDEPQGAYYGAQVAAPVFQSVARQLMLYWKVPPDDPAALASARAVGGHGHAAAQGADD